MIKQLYLQIRSGWGDTWLTFRLHNNIEFYWPRRTFRDLKNKKHLRPLEFYCQSNEGRNLSARLTNWGCPEGPFYITHTLHQLTAHMIEVDAVFGKRNNNQVFQHLARPSIVQWCIWSFREIKYDRLQYNKTSLGSPSEAHANFI